MVKHVQIVIAVALVRELIAPFTATLPSGGSHVCPCASKSDLGNVSLVGSGISIPEDYGIACDLHDASSLVSEHCSASLPPKYCQSKWCFVDIDRCTLKRHSTQQVGTALPAKASEVIRGRWYSYETCGYTDSYHSWRIEHTMNNSVVRVIKVRNTGGWKGAYCQDDGICTGPTADFVEELLQEMQAKVLVYETVTNVRISNTTSWIPPQVRRQLYQDYPTQKSAFWGCVYTAGMGYVDLCISAFTWTVGRSKASRSVKIFSEPIYLVTTRSKRKISIADYLVAPLTPFAFQTWMLVVASLSGITILVAFHESVLGGEYHGWRTVDKFFHALYSAWMSLAGAASVYQPTTVSGRLANLSLGFFVIIIVTSYTANLASGLVTLQQQSTTTISSIDDLVKKKEFICVEKSITGQLGILYPQVADLIKTTLVRSEVLPSVGDKCAAAAIRQEDYQNGDMCGKIRIGDPLFSIEIAVPVSKRFQRYLQIHALKALQVGKFKSILSKYQPERDTSSCNEDDEAADATGMKPEAMYGPVMIVAFLSIIAVFHDACRGKRTEKVREMAKTHFKHQTSMVLSHARGSLTNVIVGDNTRVASAINQSKESLAHMHRAFSAAMAPTETITEESEMSDMSLSTKSLAKRIMSRTTEFTNAPGGRSPQDLVQQSLLDLDNAIGALHVNRCLLQTAQSHAMNEFVEELKAPSIPKKSLTV